MDALLRRRLMIQLGGGPTPPPPLPYDAEVDYLQSSGVQYIDTGIYGSMSLDYEIVVQVVATSPQFQVVMGDRYSQSSRRYELMLNNGAGAGTNKYVIFNCGDSNQINDSPNQYWNNRVQVYRKVGRDVYVGGNKVGTLADQSFTTPNTIVLFGERNDGVFSNPFSGRIYHTKFISGGVVLADFIPVRVGQVGYMYDKISQRLLGNAGTGSFVVGNDITYDAEVEFLEATGTQYINTQIYPDSSFSFDSKVVLTQDQNTVFWGVRKSGTYSSDNLQCYLNVNPGGNDFAQKLNLYSTNALSSSNWSSGIKPTIGTMYSLTGMTVVPTMQTMTYPVTLFALNNIGTVNAGLGVCKIGSWEAYSNGYLVADFKPVRKGQEGYMYEAVSRRLYGNDGSGDFNIGPDK